MQYSKLVMAAAIALASASAAWADIKVGVVLSETGPAASLGIPEKKTVELFPKEIAGQKIDYIFMNDGSDPTAAVKATKKLIDEDKVDVVIGSSITPNSLAMVDVVGGAKVPNISLAAGRNIVFSVEGNRTWVFNTPQTTGLM
ncbi:MAG: ABC transporter substrate-binding protein, partial [Thiomonas sp.]